MIEIGGHKAEKKQETLGCVSWFPSKQSTKLLARRSHGIIQCVIFIVFLHDPQSPSGKSRRPQYVGCRSPERAPSVVPI